jgi:hypothetical protein
MVQTRIEAVEIEKHALIFSLRNEEDNFIVSDEKEYSG